MRKQLITSVMFAGNRRNDRRSSSRKSRQQTQLHKPMDRQVINNNHKTSDRAMQELPLKAVAEIKAVQAAVLVMTTAVATTTTTSSKATATNKARRVFK